LVQPFTFICLLENFCALVEECIFNTIFGKFEGHKILAIRKVAEMIEVWTRYAAELPKAYYQGFRYSGINHFVRGL
jgi:hypothetical protein